MPRWRYSVELEDEAKCVKASGRELDISPKHAREICRAIKNLTIEEAKRLLNDLIEKKRAIPFKRYYKGVGHRRELEGWPAGRYPVKAAQVILRVVENLEANAEFKGLDIERLRIIHAAAHRGRKVRKYVPRAFGRSTPSFDTLTHVELIAREM